MRRENHRRRGLSRASSGGWGHRAVYLGAIVASAAMVAGFGSALLIYGPLGAQQHQLIGSNLNVPPKGVSFGNASAVFGSQLSTVNASGGGWDWSTNVTGAFNGPCNTTGVLDLANDTYSNASNNSSAFALPLNTTIVCLNSINDGVLNATWYGNSTTTFTVDNYTAGGVPNGSYYNDSVVNVSSCSNFTLYHELNLTTFNGSYIPCQTYFEMNNNTTWLPSYAASGPGVANNSTLWSPNQTGYLPGDVVYQVPVFFSDAPNATYEISVAIEGVTPVAQTFFFAYNGTGNDTVLFTFDMTAAWLMDLSTANNNTTYNYTALAIYGSINVVSSIVTECSTGSLGQSVCPIATPTV